MNSMERYHQGERDDKAIISFLDSLGLTPRERSKLLANRTSILKIIEVIKADVKTRNLLRADNHDLRCKNQQLEETFKAPKKNLKKLEVLMGVSEANEDLKDTLRTIKSENNSLKEKLERLKTKIAKPKVHKTRKSVAQHDVDTGELIKEYPTQEEACLENGFSKGLLSHYFKKGVFIVGGFEWKEIDRLGRCKVCGLVQKKTLFPKNCSRRGGKGHSTICGDCSESK